MSLLFMCLCIVVLLLATRFHCEAFRLFHRKICLGRRVRAVTPEKNSGTAKSSEDFLILIFDKLKELNTKIEVIDTKIEVLQDDSIKKDHQLKRLIKYNANRDRDLESVIGGSFRAKLVEGNWNVSPLKFRSVYNTEGAAILEFDSVMFATHVNATRPVLFLGETKQFLTKSKLKGFFTRIERMRKEVLPFLHLKGPSEHRASMIKEINGLFSVPLTDGNFELVCDVKGFVGAAFIGEDVLHELKTSGNTSYVKPSQNFYDAILLGL